MTDVLIVGGGIGGLTAGIALQQHGFDAHVFEAAPELHAVGAGIWMPPNAMSVLARLGVADAVSAAGLPLDRIEVRDLGGEVLQAIDGGKVASRTGYRTVAVRRSELQRILAAALLPGSLHLGKEFVRYANEGPAVRAHFADGSDTVGRLLVGADGVRSAVRGRMRSDVALRYSGQTTFRGLAPMPLPPELRATAWEVWGGAVRFGFSGVGGGMVYWFAPITSPAGVQPDRTKLKSELLQRYAGFPAVARDAIEATPAETVLQTDLFDFSPIRGWHHDSVVLLGDAAHATTPNLGQGGAQAVEDALSLALRLRAAGIGSAALTEYERVRAPRTRRIVRLSRTFGRMAHWENPLLRRLRNIALRAAPDVVRQRQLRNLFTARV